MSDFPTEFARRMREVAERTGAPDSLDDFARNLLSARVVEDEIERIARKTRRDGTP